MSSKTFELALRAEVPDLQWPLSPDEIPPLDNVMDLIEFCHSTVAKPKELDWHSFFGHYYDYDQQEGQNEFRQAVNRAFERHGLAYELQGNGQISRVLPAGMDDELRAEFETGDAHLDQMLSTAQKKFLSPKVQVRHEALEKPWDAWERLKTLEPDKKTSVKKLLDQVSSEPNFRQLLEEVVASC